MTHKCCSIECAKQYAQMEREKSVARIAKQARQETRAKIMALKPKSYWMQRAQAAFNAWVRERDKDQLCICCGKPLQMIGYSRGGEYDAGHYRSTGAAPHLRFNEDNVHAQKKQCNRDKAGNAVEYRIGLIKRIGLVRVEALESDNSIKRWTIADYQAIEAEYRQKLKELTQGRKVA